VLHKIVFFAIIKNMEQKELFTTKQVAEMLGLSTQRIIQMIGRGQLIAEKAGRDYLITAEEVARYERERKPAGRPSKDGVEKDVVLHEVMGTIVLREPRPKKPPKKYVHLSEKYPKLSKLLNGMDAKGDEDANEVAEMIALTVLLREKGILTKERLLELEETGAIKPVLGSESLRERSAQSHGEETISTMAGIRLDE
jgi:excisionase family DNA binding protein